MKIFQLSLIVLILSLPALVAAQAETVPLSSNFKFRDGLYMDFTQFQQNQPGFAWREVVSNMASTKPGILKVASFQVGDAWESESLPLDSIWGLARNGVPYVRIPRDTGETRQFATFVALRVLGKICLYSYEREEKREVVVKAYNPVTGRPFREGTITQEEMVTEEKLIYFPTGETADLSLATLLAWIKDDAELYRAFGNLGPRPSKEELYETLMMYNERNRVYTFR